MAVIKLCANLPRSESGRHIAGQLLRCGTSPAANYGEARGAESRNDFVHKLGIVLKELHEAAVWLQIALRARLLSEREIQPLSIECEQLCRIIGSSIATTKEKHKGN